MATADKSLKGPPKVEVSPKAETGEEKEIIGILDLRFLIFDLPALPTHRHG